MIGGPTAPDGLPCRPLFPLPVPEVPKRVREAEREVRAGPSLADCDRASLSGSVA